MKYEKLDISNSKKGKWFLYGFLMCAALLIMFNLFMSYAKYKVVDSVKLAEGIVSYENADFSLIALYIQNGDKDNPTDGYKKIEDGNVPPKDVILNESQTMCKINSEEYIGKTSYEKQGIFIAYRKGKLNFTGINKANTKCTVYFDYGSGTADDTLENLFSGFTTLDSGTNFSKDEATGVLKVTGIDDKDHLKTLYKAEDNDGISYFFRGQASDNWVQFANMRWRIIRINGDGTIRIIYQCSGDTCTNGANAINNIAYKSSPWDDNTYVGYYNKGSASTTYEEAHNGSVPSTIAEKVNEWYKTNIVDKNFGDYVDKNAGFCNDRQIVTGLITSYNGTGAGTSMTSYAAAGRVYKNASIRSDVQYPTLKCGVDAKTAEEQETITTVNEDAYKRDLYTVTGAKKGNQKLEYPVGLITSDEVILAGGFHQTANSNFYLCNNQSYWTMSPYLLTSDASVFYVYSSGNLTHYGVHGTSFGARPVINLKADTTFITNKEEDKGTINNPYIVQ